MLLKYSPAPSLPPEGDISFTFGVIEIGIIVVVFLTGIATLQVWNYFRDYPHDSWVLKLTVSFLYLTDMVHTALLAQALHYYTILNFGNYTKLDKLTATLIATVPIASVVTFVVRICFCYRIKIITYRWTYAVGCWVLSIILLVFDSLVAVSVAASGTFSEIHTSRTQVLGVVTLALGAATDLILAGFLCMGLLRARGSGMASTNRILDKLIAYAISTGMLTSFMAMVEAIVFGLFENYAFLAFYCIIPKLFSNSFFASLNERSYLQREGQSVAHAVSVTNNHIAFERVTIATARSEFELGAVTHTQFETGSGSVKAPTTLRSESDLGTSVHTRVEVGRTLVQE
ncbi:hypothetical protein EXIGLDRAFT_766179 [Exidia glandulosa HHB12029]|uniref:DUF6534 domain-containing protein n=1 Tax=Exidia glandulosa HHB12029 TaxID=1314781 RepID=A0A165JXP5_EXIGL|nr:hypothetical protein EXIGLDRAFT_766179 [Exidia glandulosa HHB12029]